MPETATEVRIRPLTELDIGGITRIDEKVTGRYRPEEWERRVGYYIRRDPDASVVAEREGAVVGFMMGEVRGGEFGLEEPTGWIEVLGVDPECKGRSLGRRMAEAMFGHFKERGAGVVRTLVDVKMEHLCGFFEAMGFEPAPLRPYVRSL